MDNLAVTPRFDPETARKRERSCRNLDCRSFPRMEQIEVRASEGGTRVWVAAWISLDADRLAHVGNAPDVLLSFAPSQRSEPQEAQVEQIVHGLLADIQPEDFTGWQLDHYPRSQRHSVYSAIADTADLIGDWSQRERKLRHVFGLTE